MKRASSDSCSGEKGLVWQWVVVEVFMNLQDFL